MHLLDGTLQSLDRKEALIWLLFLPMLLHLTDYIIKLIMVLQIDIHEDFKRQVQGCYIFRHGIAYRSSDSFLLFVRAQYDVIVVDRDLGLLFSDDVDLSFRVITIDRC